MTMNASLKINSIGCVLTPGINKIGHTYSVITENES